MNPSPSIPPRGDAPPSGWLLAAGLLSIVLLAAPALAASVAAPGPAPLDPARVPWTELDFKASKLTVSATSEVALETVPAAEAVELLEPAAGRQVLAPRGETALLMSLRSRLLGRDSEMRLWLDPDASALGRTQLDTGKKRNRFTAYRFTRQGVHRRRLEPDGDGEAGLPHQRWSDVSESFYPYPGDLEPGAPVVEPSALLYLVSAAELSRPGDRLAVYAFSRKRLHRVEILVMETTPLKVDYQEISAGGVRTVEGRVDALRLSIQGRPTGGEVDDDDFQFLGLRGDIDLYLDPATRVPLAVSGQMRIVGRVQVRLQRAVLR